MPVQTAQGRTEHTASTFGCLNTLPLVCSPILPVEFVERMILPATSSTAIVDFPFLTERYRCWTIVSVNYLRAFRERVRVVST